MTWNRFWIVIPRPYVCGLVYLGKPSVLMYPTGLGLT